MKTISVLIMCSIFAVGCVVTPPPPTGFYWGNYSRTLYDYKKNPGEETLAKHQHTLEDLIANADSKETVKVPPGVYAELGQIYLDKGDKAEAIKWFQQEVIHFPESEKMIVTLIEKAKDE